MFPLPYNLIFSRKVYIAGGISGVALLAALVLIYQVDTQALVKTLSGASPRSSPGKVYLGAPAAAAVPVVAKAPVREMNIANNGLVLLRGATVTANSGGTLRVGMTWGAAEFTWKVETDSGTQFMTKSGEKLTVEDISVGDVITVTGTLKGSGSEPFVVADYVRI